MEPQEISEHIRHANAAANTAILSRRTMDTNVHFPWVRIRGFHLYAQFCQNAAALGTAGADGDAVHFAGGFAVKFMLISETGIAFPLAVVAGRVAGTYTEQLAAGCIDVIVVAPCVEGGIILFGIKEFPVYIQLTVAIMLCL